MRFPIAMSIAMFDHQRVKVMFEILRVQQPLWYPLNIVNIVVSDISLYSMWQLHNKLPIDPQQLGSLVLGSQTGAGKSNAGTRVSKVSSLSRCNRSAIRGKNTSLQLFSGNVLQISGTLSSKNIFIRICRKREREKYNYKLVSKYSNV